MLQLHHSQVLMLDTNYQLLVTHPLSHTLEYLPAH